MYRALLLNDIIINHTIVQMLGLYQPLIAKDMKTHLYLHGNPDLFVIVVCSGNMFAKGQKTIIDNEGRKASTNAQKIKCSNRAKTNDLTDQ
jgi:hypothetical protein